MDHRKRIDEALDKMSDEVSLLVIMDINKRITDWMSSGGNAGDPYIEQQVRYAENVAKAYGGE